MKRGRDAFTEKDVPEEERDYDSSEESEAEYERPLGSGNLQDDLGGQKARASLDFIADDDDEETMLDDSIKQRVELGREQMRSLIQSFTPEQQKRYEVFRRAAFPRPIIKRLIAKYTDVPPSTVATIILAGIGKVIVGELVEEALRIQDLWAETGPLKPSHILEAHRRLQANGKIPARLPSALI